MRLYLYPAYRVVLWIIFIASTIVGQTKIEKDTPPRITNQPRIARAWNSINPAVEQWNEHIRELNRLLQDRFNPRIVDATPDETRKRCVARAKAAREALLKELDALNEIIDEDDR